MNEVDARQGMRAAMQLIERDVRMAGSGWGTMAVQGAYAGDTLTLYGVNPGFGGTAGNDSISVLGGWDVSTTLTSAMPNTNSNIRVASVTGFATNDLIVITNDTKAHLFQVTGISSLNLNHATSSAFNNTGTGHINWLGGYSSGAKVYKVGWVSYRMDSTLYRRKSLIRYQVGAKPQLIASDIATFRVNYELDDGTTTRNPASVAVIEHVQPSIRPKAAAGTAADSAWADIRPRTF
jgi:hypothetical protein